MTKFKSNPYVYPFIPFKDLKRNIKYRAIIEKPKIINWSDVNKQISSLKTEIPTEKEKAVEESVLNLFLDEEIRFGPIEFISDNKKLWLEKLRLFIVRNKPIQFTLLGFPFKSDVPLKTNRKLPDMGDVLALHRLNLICNSIKNIYEPGIIIHIFTEGPLGPFCGIPRITTKLYAEFLGFLNKRLKYDECLKLHDLGDIENKKGWKKDFERKVVELNKLLSKRDPEFITKFEGAYNSIYRIISTSKYPLNLLFKVYSDLPDNKLDQNSFQIRKQLREDTTKSTVNYYAYLAIRDKYKYLEEIVPNGVPLSVSPKPGRLGVIPVHRNIKILPHHGVTIYDNKLNSFNIVYLIDLMREKCRLRPVYLKEDLEKTPFYYIKS